MVFPRIWFEYESKEPNTFVWYYISVTEHQLYNRPERQCEVSTNYDFQTCVKNSLAERVGCRPPWDTWSPTSIPVCDTLEKNSEHEQLDWKFFNYEQKIVINSTKCLIPCNYKEYKVVGEPQGGSSTVFGTQGSQGYFHFGFNFASTDIGKQKEDLVYPPVSFISELGGSLGLFVGFSFLTIWDCIEYMMERSKTVKDYVW